jgi:4-amino-4-deoxy-L-arabinose transferase-like glycosyltransferase
MLIGLAVVVPWVVLMGQRLPNYLHYVLVTETWKRISTDDLHRTEPFWFFIPILLVGSFPWILLLIAWAWRCRHKRPRLADPRIRYLALWIALPFLFFSMSRSKLPHYMLPLIPAIALLTAAGLAEGEFRLPAGRSLAAAAWCVLGALLVGAALIPGLLAHLEPALLYPARGIALTVGVAGLVAGAIGLVARPRGPWLAATLCLPMITMALGGGHFIALVAEARSASRLAESIEKELPGERQIVGVSAYPTALPFYLRAPVVVSSANGKELTSNYVLANYLRLIQEHDSPLRGPDWWKTALRECREPTAFVVGTQDTDHSEALVAAGLPLIAADRKYSAYGPCRPAAVATARTP